MWKIVRVCVSVSLWVFVAVVIRWVRRVVPSPSSSQAFFPSGDPVADNEWRLNEARSIYSRTAPPAFTESPELEVTVIAVERPYQFLTQVIAYLLAESGKVGYQGMRIRVCAPSSLTSEELALVGNFVPIVRVDERVMGEVQGDTYEQRVEIEARHYEACIRATTSSAPFLLVLEDDALPVDGFFLLLASVISQLRKNPDLDYVKLYHPTHYRKVPYYFQLTVLAMLMTLAVHYVVWRRSAQLLFVLQFFVPIYLLHSHTFQLMVDLRYVLTGSVYLSSPESCCTPAVLYKSASLAPLLARFAHDRTSADRAKDHILDDSQLNSRMTDANLIVHIGFYSSIRQAFVVLDGNVKSPTRFF